MGFSPTDSPDRRVSSTTCDTTQATPRTHNSSQSGGRSRAAAAARPCDTARSLFIQLSSLGAQDARRHPGTADDADGAGSSDDSDGGPSSKRARSNVAQDVAQFVEELRGAGSCVGDAADVRSVIDLVVLVAISPASLWTEAPARFGTSATSATDESTPTACARALLRATFPSAMPFDVTCRLLGAFGQIAELRADAMRWIVQVHEGLNCWGELTRAHPALLFHVRDPVLTRDASYALLRVCQAHSASADGGGRALLSTWELGRVHRLAKTLERPPPALSAIVAHQVNGRCDELTQAICTSAPFHDVNGLADYWHNVHPDSIDALAASDAFADEAVGLDRHWTAELQGRLKANGATDAQGGEADGEGGRSVSAAGGRTRRPPPQARAGRHPRRTSRRRTRRFARGGLPGRRRPREPKGTRIRRRPWPPPFCRSWSHVVHSRAARTRQARGRPPGIARPPRRRGERRPFEAPATRTRARPAGVARTAFAVG